MRKREISKFEIRTATSGANLVNAAGYGVASTQDFECGSKPAQHHPERVALLILTPLLAITALAGVMFTLVS